MCVTKKKQNSVQSKNSIGPRATVNAPTPAITPVTQSTTAQSGTKGSKSKLVPVDAKDPQNGKPASPGFIRNLFQKSKMKQVSENEKKSEKQEEKVSHIKKITERATTVGRGPPVDPPVKRDAKRVPDGFKSAKDSKYVTLQELVPVFEKATLKGFNDRGGSNEKTLKVEPTQPSSGDDQKKKKSGEKSSGEGIKE
ncbi:hypothetical protein CRE_31464 [Caenorhabditis remanei]|nr:hypothetical protein CRE_31464 [Caenorhabditis remanei]